MIHLEGLNIPEISLLYKQASQKMDSEPEISAAAIDLAESDWDRDKDGEPPMDNPAYYLRYCKTFNRMGGEMHYLTADNRDFLLALYQKLNA